MKAGVVHVLGQANVGKSTFINAVVGDKVSITSNKPQTTRRRIRSVCNRDDSQIVFVDTPGLHKPVGKLGEHLLDEAREAFTGADVLVYIIEPWGEINDYDQKLIDQLNDLESPIILLVNKVDIYSKQDVVETLDLYGDLDLFEEYVPLSSLRGENVDTAVKLIVDRLPEGPPLFSEDQQLAEPEEFLISEYVREKVYQLTEQEIPYSVAVKTESIRRRDDGLMEVTANIYVAEKSQKGILIGKNGQMIKDIGSRAREDVQQLLGEKVYLDLRVKVSKKWNKREGAIESFSGTD